MRLLRQQRFSTRRAIIAYVTQRRRQEAKEEGAVSTFNEMVLGLPYPPPPPVETCGRVMRGCQRGTLLPMPAASHPVGRVVRIGSRPSQLCAAAAIPAKTRSRP